MNWWQRLRHRDRVERELDAELRDHFERQVEDNRRMGMSQAEAHRRARLEFGGADSGCLHTISICNVNNINFGHVNVLS